jgi:DNA polymerase
MAEPAHHDEQLYPGFNKPPVPDMEAEVGEKLPAEKSLALLAEKIRVCRNCDLSESRMQAVPGEGNPHARIMFVGEAPGAMEDKTGRPFVGPSGKFLESMLADIGLRREDVFIANVNRCRPPGNRDPLAWEVEACNPWLRAQVQIIQPKVMCPMGRFALEALLDPHLKISKVHGQPFEREGMLVIPLYHPAAALHRQDLRETLQEDMRKVRQLMEARGLW